MFGRALAACAVAALTLSVAAHARPEPGGLAARTVGEEVELVTFNPAIRVDGAPRVAQLVWSEVLQFPGATYIAPHFSRFQLPRGAYVVVRDPMSQRHWTLTGQGKPEAGGSFWGIHVNGDTAIVELWSRRNLPAQAVAVDKFARGFNEWELPDWRPTTSPQETICGTDDSQWAKCYQTSEATAYGKSRAVARLLINGTSACTGWLVGSEGHIMTNEHCIGNATAAANTNFEFMAEGTTCSTNCASWGACAGTVVASSSTVVRINAALDYALVRLPTNPTATYGYLQMRNAGATLGERIYIPQHPAHWGKKIAMTAGTGNATVTSLSEPPCSGSGYNDVGYMADTQGGSSGSPVLGYSDNAVIALHHCADCPNRAVPIQRVISDLGTSVPANATTGAGGGGGGGGGGGTVLQNGVPQSSLSGATGSQRTWTMAVPTGASNLNISISGGSGDADLYVRFGTAPTTSTYDCRPYKSGNAETCTFATPSAGTWHVMLHGYAAYSGVTLSGTYSTGGTCSGGTNHTGTLSSGSNAYTTSYTTSVTGTHSGALAGPSGTDFDLYLQKWNGSSWASVASGTTSSNNENVSYSGTAGTYRWRVHAYSGSGSWSLCARRP